MITPRAQHATLFRILLYSTIASLPFAFVRLPLGPSTISTTTLLALVTLLITIPLIDRTSLISLARRYGHPLILWALFCTIIGIAALETGTLRGWGIFIEWFLMPSVLLLTLLLWRRYITQLHLHILHAITGSMFIACVTIYGQLLLDVLHIVPYDSFTYDGRLRATWPSPNHIALFFVPGILATAGTAITSSSRIMRTASLVVLAWSTIIVILSQSIFGMLALLCGGMIVGMHYRSKRQHVRALGIIVILGLIVLPVFVERGERFFEDVARSSLASRIVIWDVTTTLLRAAPLTPHGLDTFQELYLDHQRFHPPYLEWAVPTPHNLYLTVWYSGGFFALVFFLLFIAALFYRTSHNKTISLFICAALCAVLFHGFFDTPYFRIDLAYLTLMLIGAHLLTTVRRPTRQRRL